MDDRSRYFQGISRAFFSRRGAPFFLSPKDQALIEGWECSGIPLDVVLEGIERSFEARSPGAAVRGKVLTLAFCDAAVRRAFAQFRDRAVGGRPASAAARQAPDPRAKARAAVDEFLARAAAEAPFLEGLFQEAKGVLESGLENGAAGEELERLDERAAGILLEKAGDGEPAAAAREIRKGHPDLPARERTAAARTLLLKRLRAKFRVPYLSLHYY